MAGIIVVVIVLFIVLIFFLGSRNKRTQNEANIIAPTSTQASNINDVSALKDVSSPKDVSASKVVPKALYVFGFAPLVLLLVTFIPSVPWAHYENIGWRPHIPINIWKIIQVIGTKDTIWGNTVESYVSVYAKELLICLCIMIGCSILIAVFPLRLMSSNKNKGNFPNLSWTFSILGALFGVIVTCVLGFGFAPDIMKSFGNSGIAWLFCFLAGFSMLIYLVVVIANNKRITNLK
jgi:hypothetical protein